MFNGSVNLVARVRGNGITFPSVDFNPNVAGVDHVTIEASDPGDRILAIVHMINVNTQEDGRKIAQKDVTDALNRIAYYHGMAIESSRSTADQFMPGNAGAGAVGTVAVVVHLFAHGAAHAVVGIPADQIKDSLDQAAPGEHNFGMYRSAPRSTSPVEKFMHVYNILLML